MSKQRHTYTVILPEQQYKEIEQEKRRKKNINPKTTATDHWHKFGMSNICKMRKFV